MKNYQTVFISPEELMVLYHKAQRQAKNEPTIEFYKTKDGLSFCIPNDYVYKPETHDTWFADQFTEESNLRIWKKGQKFYVQRNTRGTPVGVIYSGENLNDVLETMRHQEKRTDSEWLALRIKHGDEITGQVGVNEIVIHSKHKQACSSGKTWDEAVHNLRKYLGEVDK